LAENSSIQDKVPKVKAWAWEAIAVAAITATGYSLALIHEIAFCDVFGIPKEFIQLDWESILLAIGSFIGFSIFVLWMMAVPAWFVKKAKKRPGPVARRLVSHAVLLMIFIAFVNRFFVPWSLNSLLSVLFSFLFLLYFVAVDYLVPLWTQRSIKRYRDKLEAQDKRDSEFFRNFGFVRSVGKVGVTIVMAAFLLFMISYSDGQSSALKQEEFLIPSTSQQLVVLKAYGDILVCAPIDMQKHQVRRVFSLIKIGEEPTLTLTPRRVGPLTVSPYP